MPTMYLMVGVPGSGKSTIAQSIVSYLPRTRLLSSDEYRAIHFGDVNDQTHNREVFSLLQSAAIEALCKGENVVIDATNLTKKSRRTFLELREFVEFDVVAVVMMTPPCLVGCYNLMRSRHVPNEVIFRMMDQLSIDGLLEEEVDCVVYKGSNGKIGYEWIDSAERNLERLREKKGHLYY